MLEGNYPVEYLEKVRQQNHRRMMWMVKFAFPKVNTRTTKILLAMPGTHSYRFAVPPKLDFKPMIFDKEAFKPTQVDEIELRKFAYKGKRWVSWLRCGYYEKLDIAVIVIDSFEYKSRQLFDYWRY